MLRRLFSSISLFLDSSLTLTLVLGLIAVTMPAGAAAQTNLGSVNLGGRMDVLVNVNIPAAATVASISVGLQGAANLEFSRSSGGTCALTHYTANSTCTVGVQFTPKVAGARYGAVVLADANGNAVGTTHLQGIGIGPLITFAGNPSIIVANQFVSPEGVAVDGKGNVYVAEGQNTGALYKETLQPDGSFVESTIGSGWATSYYVAVDGAGNVYVLTNSGCFKETLRPNGTYGQSKIDTVFIFSVDANGNFYTYSDNGGGASFTVFKHALQPNGSFLQSTIDTLPNFPFGAAADASGNVYIVAYPFNDIQGQQEGVLYSETLQSDGTYLQSTIGSGLYQPTAVAVDGPGNVYISHYQIVSSQGTDHYYSWITKETKQSNGSYAQNNVVQNPGLFNGVAVDASGSIYYSDVPLGGVSSPAVFEQAYTSVPPSSGFAPTAQGATSSDSPRTVPIFNFGNTPLNFSAVTYPADFPEGSSATTECAASRPLAAGSSCNLTINFTPIAALNGAASLDLSEAVTVTSNTSNASGTSSAITVTGTETAPRVMTPVISPAPGNYTAPFSVTITDPTAGATIYYTTDGTSPTTSSTKYTSPFTVSVSEQIIAMGVLSGYVNSALASASYTIGPAPDFTATIAPSALSASSAQPGTATITVTPQNGFSSSVSFSCSGLPAGATCSFAPATVTPSGAAATTALTVSTSRAAAILRAGSYPFFPGFALGIALCCFGWKKRSRVSLPFALGAFGLILLTGCGGSNSTSNPPPNAVTVTLTATSGSLRHTTTFSLTVQ